MTINANTKIATILKQRPEALEAIIGINHNFEKLRNPILRKLMAGRTSLAMASKIGGCTVADLFAKLKPIGFEIDEEILPASEEKKQMPDFLTTLNNLEIIDLDVRPIMVSGGDPLTLIIEKVKTMQAGQVLKIINSFEPVPLMMLLKKQGFESFANVINNYLVETYFYKKDEVMSTDQAPVKENGAGLDAIMGQFKSAIRYIDVRPLEMPLPMVTILEALDNLPSGSALFVYHKRIPVFLLPELAERKFNYRIKEISDGEVHLLIFKS